MQFSPDFVRALVARPYVGNVRELEAALWASVRESNGERLEAPREIAPGLPRCRFARTKRKRFTHLRRLSAPPPDPARVQECLDQHGRQHRVDLARARPDEPPRAGAPHQEARPPHALSVRARMRAHARALW